MECFICWSISGKTEDEIAFEKTFNTKTMNYPLLSMAYVYNCKCINNYAHNKCLVNIKRCPTCRKKCEPNLYIYTQYDNYLPFLLDWLKKDISNIEKLKVYTVYYLLFIFGLVYLFGKNKETFHMIIPPHSNISIYFATVISVSCFIAIYLLVVFSDYIQKYWLYDKEQKKYYVFKNTEYNTEIIELLLQDELYM